MKPPSTFAAVELNLKQRHFELRHLGSWESCTYAGCTAARAELERMRRLVEAVTANRARRHMVDDELNREEGAALAACQLEGNDAQEK